MTGPAARLKELGQLARNVREAGLATNYHPSQLFTAELADWVERATAIIGELVLDGAIKSEPRGEPASCSDCGGAVVDEAGRPLLLVEPRCFDCAVDHVVERMEGHS